MKLFVVLCVVLLALDAVSAKNKPENEKKAKSLKKVFKECQKNDATKIDNSILKKLKKHKQVDLPDNYGDHKLCILKGLGYINEFGMVIEKNLKKRVTKKAEVNQDIDAIVSECKVSKATPTETALFFETCLTSHSITL
ncbi:unnamed protein product [Ceutorhynchus assimilis]|uniref:Uncharacterized protein n=1 Tax=Ceutorhynchus assimilis TaxID=467358 RepID=A0A9N9QDI8_9CUCU|nr:unnamed protein product [Ceutorhynchus assimilis]